MDPPKDPILAAILSVIMPGLGQFYCRQWFRGFLFLLGVFFLIALAPPIGMFLSAGLWVWGIVDAYRIARARHINTYSRGEGPIIEVSKLRLPRIESSQILTYVGIPLGIVVLLAVIVMIIAVRSGVWEYDGSKENVGRLITKIKQHKRETGSYPDSLETLIDSTDPIEKKGILDPWGNVYIYRASEDAFSLSSTGIDGQPGTADDIQYEP